MIKPKYRIYATLLREVKKEAIAFIGGKYAVDPQGDLFKEQEETK